MRKVETQNVNNQIINVYNHIMINMKISSNLANKKKVPSLTFGIELTSHTHTNCILLYSYFKE